MKDGNRWLIMIQYYLLSDAVGAAGVSSALPIPQVNGRLEPSGLTLIYPCISW